MFRSRFFCLVALLLVGCSTSSTPDQTGDDGGAGGTSTADAGATGNACGAGAAACTVDVCPSSGAACTAAGVSPATVACSATYAQYDDASGTTTLALSPCSDAAEPALVFTISGMFSPGTYDSTDVAFTDDTALLCAGDLGGDSWGVTTGDGADDGSAVGSFILTLTSVTPDTAEATGQTLFTVHGSVKAQCAGASGTGAAAPAGTVTLTATF